MTTESNLDRLSPARALRWAVFFLFVLAAVTAYFLYGRHVPPFAAPAHDAAAVDASPR